MNSRVVVHEKEEKGYCPQIVVSSFVIFITSLSLRYLMQQKKSSWVWKVNDAEKGGQKYSLGNKQNKNENTRLIMQQH